MNGFDWSDLPACLAMPRAGRLTVAAQRLGVDHSTRSHRIAALAAALAVRLSKRKADIAIGMARPTQRRVHARELVDYAPGL